MAVSRELQVGDQIDHYIIRSLRGPGGSTLVYEAEDTVLKRTVAIKVCTTPRGKEASPLLLEAQNLVDLKAPHTARIFSVGEHQGETYFVYEFMSSSLRDELNLHKNLTWQNCLRSMLRICEAMDHLHRRGYVHADIRPRNIMYDSRGFCYLTDMATTHHVDAMKWNMVIKLAEKNIDLVKYAPPEARLSPDTYYLDPSFDVWSLGLIMYEALTGTSLVIPKQELVANGFNHDIRLPSSFDAAIPTIFDDICASCLSLDPEDRYSSSQVLGLLRQINESEQAFKPSVFISHATADREFVEQHLVRFLESNAVTTWYSKVSIRSAAEWERSILQGLQETAWFLLVMSEASAQSEWVKDEVFWAIDNRKGKIIPVIIDHANMADFHIRLRRIQAVDLRFNPDSDNDKILRILQGDL